jgi:glycosyltransferase involved in cell wall biosynthesis
VPELPVSAVVLTRNEELNLPRCLRSLAGLGEIFVVDSHSEDGTRAVAHAHGAQLVDFDWNGRYPKKKQWCLDNVPFRFDWVLYLDADEELTPELRDEIAALFAGGGPDHAGYFVRFDDVFLGRRLRYGHRMTKLVLLDRRRSRFDPYPDLDATTMWEVEGHYQPTVDGSTGVLRARAVHDDGKPLYEWIARHNRYSDWEAVVRGRDALARSSEAQPGARRWLKRVFDRVPAKAPAFFLWSYVLRGGFLDGRAGLHFALAKSFYYWQVDLKTRELRARSGSQAVGELERAR